MTEWITIPDLIAIAVALLGASAAYWKARHDIDSIKEEVQRNEKADEDRDNALRREFEGKIEAKFAVGNEALKRHEQRDDSMQRELTDFKVATERNFSELRTEMREGFQRVFDRLERKES